MARKMQAAVVEHFGKPLVMRELDIPIPAAGQILVQTEACGVCHTDLHAATGDWPLKPILPFIPGHEAIGRVAAVGAGVTLVKEGDRVGVPWLYSACGHCEYCLTAWETVCADAKFGGYTQNGGFAEYLLADPNYVAHIPAGLDAKQAAPLICAGITTYKGLLFRVRADWAIWPFNMPRSWGFRFVPSISTTASWPLQRKWAPISWSTRSTRMPSRPSRRAHMAARMGF
jgi:propanol-preferring alcohol dehydrogenase